MAPEHLADPGGLARSFAAAEPFPHLVLERFLAGDVPDRLLSEFPRFEDGCALNEAGEPGGKATCEQLRDLGPAFRRLDELMRGAAFLRWLSAATGIPDLLYDPWYFGGGTHENRHGQDLDSHIDFNYHPVTGWHRRLNLIVYLNPCWEADWGGALELHRDPRRPEQDEVVSYLPVMNRCVIFETSERSWHGFRRVELPPEQRALSRRSVAFYFYTRTRPAAETAPTHSTVYVDWPLPGRFAPGHRLDEEDVAALQVLLRRRDMHLERLYGALEEQQARIESLEAQLAAGALPRLLQRLRRLLRRGFISSSVRVLPASLLQRLRRRSGRRGPRTGGDGGPAPG